MKIQKSLPETKRTINVGTKQAFLERMIQKQDTISEKKHFFCWYSPYPIVWEKVEFLMKVLFI